MHTLSLSHLMYPADVSHDEGRRTFGKRRAVLELRLAEAERRVAAVEALRARQAEHADFYSEIGDDVRAAVLLHSLTELREALSA